MRHITFALLLFFTLSSVGCRSKLSDGNKVSLDVCGTKVDLEVAMTDASRARGLMFRKEPLHGNEGMIFLFSDEQPRSFWMANVSFPLDILFLNSKGNVVSMTTMHPQPGVPEGLLTRYPSHIPARYAIELREGWIQAHGLKLGCDVSLPSKITDAKLD